MTIELNALIGIVGVLANLLILHAHGLKLESRITKLETLIGVLMGRDRRQHQKSLDDGEEEMHG